MRVLFCGDVHGNIGHLRRVLAHARDGGAQKVVQCGDFGYWAHTGDGVRFLDRAAEAIAQHGVPLVFVDGNHDNRSHLLEHHRERDGQGFVVVREGLGYADRGHRWVWDDTVFVAFGGAYSTDAGYRVMVERARTAKARDVELHRRRAGRPAKPVEDHTGTLLFPGEQATDEQAGRLLDALAQVRADVLVCHDKPTVTSPALNRKNDPESAANQARVQRFLDHLQPKLLVHGHLHFRYTEQAGSCRVEGLAADDQARSDMPGWRLEHSVLMWDPAGTGAG